MGVKGLKWPIYIINSVDTIKLNYPGCFFRNLPPLSENWPNEDTWKTFNLIAYTKLKRITLVLFNFDIIKINKIPLIFRR